MKRLALIFTLLVALLSAAFFVRATCDPTDTGTAGNDTIVCDTANQPSGDVEGGGGSDTIIVENGVNTPDSIFGDSSTGIPGSGNDTIINNGIINGVVAGDSNLVAANGDDDMIINNGTINSDVFGDNGGGGGGSDTIINNGYISNDLFGDGGGPSTGDDTIINNGTVGYNIMGDNGAGGTGDDVIINNGTVIYGISGDGNGGTGNDTITNNGDVNLDIDSQGGSDVIINNGVVNGSIDAGDGDDTVTNSNTVGNNIIAGGGNDTVAIDANTAQVGGTIDGGAGYDVLTFNVTSASPEELQSWADQIYAANPNGGSIILAGHTYTWTNFEELTQLLFSLARINGVADPLAVYCSLDDGIDVYAIVGDEGVFSLHISGGVISGGIEQAVNSGTLVEIGSSVEAIVYATTLGDLQLNAPSGFSFTFTFQTYCGALPQPSETEPVIEEEELPLFSIINQPYGG